MMTLEDVENIPKEFLLANDIAPFLKMNPATIHFYAKNKPELLGFPVIVTGKMVRIPKHAFVYFCKYGRPTFDKELLYRAISSVEQAKNERVERDKTTERIPRMEIDNINLSNVILNVLQIPQVILDCHAQLNALVGEHPIKIPVKKAAQFIGIHEDTLREMIDEGRCPFALGMHKGKHYSRYTVIPTYNFYMWQTQWFLIWLMATRGEDTLMQRNAF